MYQIVCGENVVFDHQFKSEKEAQETADKFNRDILTDVPFKIKKR